MARLTCDDTIEVYRDGRVRLPANFNLGSNRVSLSEEHEITFRKAKPGEVVLKPYYATGVGVQAASPVLAMRRIFQALQVRPEEISGTYEPIITENSIILQWGGNKRLSRKSIRTRGIVPLARGEARCQSTSAKTEVVNGGSEPKKTTTEPKATVAKYDLSEAMPKPKNRAQAQVAVQSLLARADQLRAERKAAGQNRGNYPGQAKLRQLAHTYRRIAAKFDLSEQLPEFHANAAASAVEPSKKRLRYGISFDESSKSYRISRLPS